MKSPLAEQELGVTVCVRMYVCVFFVVCVSAGLFRADAETL